jgi:hypothetical protein
MEALDASCDPKNQKRKAWLTPALLTVLAAAAAGFWWTDKQRNAEPGLPPILSRSHPAEPPPPAPKIDAPVITAPRLLLPSTEDDTREQALAMAAATHAQEAQETAAAAHAEKFAPTLWVAAEDKRKIGQAAIEFNIYDKAQLALEDSVTLYARAQQAAVKEALRQTQQREAEKAERQSERRAALLEELRTVQSAMGEAELVRTEAPDVWREIQKDLHQGNELVQQEKFDEASGSLKNVLIRLESVMLFLRSRPHEPKPRSTPPPKVAAAAPTLSVRLVPPEGFRGAAQFELLVNGKSLGDVTLPHGPITLIPGPHNFQLRNHDRLADSDVGVVKLGPGDTEIVDVPVAWRPSVVVFKVEPSEAAITIKRPGQAAISVNDLRQIIEADVEYNVEADAPGYRTVTQSLRVQRGETRTVSLSLSKNPKILVRP